MHQGNLTAWGLVDYDTLAILAEGGVWRPERSENGRAGWNVSGFIGMLMSDFIDESR
jgi:hypothetical protein